MRKVPREADEDWQVWCGVLWKSRFAKKKHACNIDIMEARMAALTSQEILKQIADFEGDRTSALDEVQSLAFRRPEVLKNGTDKAVEQHDQAASRASRAVERANAHLADLKAALTVAEQREREQAVRELRDHAAALAVRYRNLAEGRFLEAARTLVAVLSEMD